MVGGHHRFVAPPKSPPTRVGVGLTALFSRRITHQKGRMLVYKRGAPQSRKCCVSVTFCRPSRSKSAFLSTWKENPALSMEFVLVLRPFVIILSCTRESPVNSSFAPSTLRRASPPVAKILIFSSRLQVRHREVFVLWVQRGKGIIFLGVYNEGN